MEEERMKKSLSNEKRDSQPACHRDSRAAHIRTAQTDRQTERQTPRCMIRLL
jgi:hypothetical protein